MPDQIAHAAHQCDRDHSLEPSPEREQVREYVGSLAAELAKMAMNEGYASLAEALEAAATLAAGPIEEPSTLRARA